MFSLFSISAKENPARNPACNVMLQAMTGPDYVHYLALDLVNPSTL